MISKDQPDEKGAENSETVRRISIDIIEPALQEALSKARAEASAQEVVSALANCYGALLVDLLGRDGAATFLQGHAVHIASLKEKATTN